MHQFDDKLSFNWNLSENWHEASIVGSVGDNTAITIGSIPVIVTHFAAIAESHFLVPMFSAIGRVQCGVVELIDFNSFGCCCRCSWCSRCCWCSRSSRCWGIASGIDLRFFQLLLFLRCLRWSCSTCRWRRSPRWVHRWWTYYGFCWE